MLGAGLGWAGLGWAGLGSGLCCVVLTAQRRMESQPILLRLSAPPGAYGSHSQRGRVDWQRPCRGGGVHLVATREKPGAFMQAGPKASSDDVTHPTPHDAAASRMRLEI
ncbi:hypothetical protein IWX90DRAFT_417958 [Phyllosticta citrichinensis]|uniref:Secreted protein n=1 Tax=Phyllosticta citrichinensis TaxID=1130410 RepID=A0ABR1XJC8_9PEZI